MSHDAIAGALRDMLGPDIGIGITDPADAIDDLWEVENPAMARAIPKRRSEFAAGRRAARAGMASLGLPQAAIPQGPDRAPVWPAGLAGSIAHCETLCIAAVSQTHRSIGIDIEPATPLADDLIPIICADAEQAWLPQTGRGRVAKQIFSAKEAVYKAQYPLIGRIIGFDDVILSPAGDGRFAITFPDASMPAVLQFVTFAEVGNMFISACKC